MESSPQASQKFPIINAAKERLSGKSSRDGRATSGIASGCIVSDRKQPLNSRRPPSRSLIIAAAAPTDSDREKMNVENGNSLLVAKN